MFGFAKYLSMSLLLASLLTQTSCAQLATAPEDGSRLSLASGGIDRTYLLGGSNLENKPDAAIIALHGGRGNGKVARRGYQFEALARRDNVLMVYPDGIGDPDVMVGGLWNDARQARDPEREERTRPLRPDDVGFLVDLKERIADVYDIPDDRVFLVGASNGGMMAMRVACEASDTFQGYGIVIANLPEGAAEACRPTHPKSMIFIAGTDDPLMPYDGGRVVPMNDQDRGRVIGTEETVEWWVNRNDCVAVPEETVITEANGDELTQTVRFDWAGCQDDTKIRFFKIEKGGHRWSNDLRTGPLARFSGRSTTDIAFEEQIWSFLR